MAKPGVITPGKPSAPPGKTPPPPPPPLYPPPTSYAITLIDVPNADTFVTGTNEAGTERVGDYFLQINGASVQYGYTQVGNVITAFVVPGAVNTQLLSVNDQGNLLGRYNDGFGNDDHGFFYDKATGVVTTIPLPGDVDPIHMNNSNIAIGFDDIGSFIYNANTNVATEITHAGWDDIRAQDINDGGIVVGNYIDHTTLTEHGFLMSAGGQFTTYDVPATIGTSTKIIAINDDGDIAGEFKDPSLKDMGFLFHNGVFVTMDMGDVTDLNNNDLVTGFDNSTPQLRALVYSPDNNRLIDITPTGGSATAVAIDSKNVVSGFVDFGSGSHGFYATPF